MSRNFTPPLAGFSDVEFTYRLTGTGWAEAWIANGSVTATITASYLEDALGELLEAVGLLLEGADEARCSWEEEAGENRWIFDRAGSDVRLRVIAFADIYPHDSEDNGTVIFETSAPLRDVATAIAGGAQKVFDEYGEAEYLRRWVDHPFPTGYLELIQAHLAST